MKKPTIKPPFSYFGGKSGLATKIAGLLPSHNTYVEVFGGSGAVLFAKPQSRLEVFNDIDEGVINFFRILRDDRAFSELKRLLDFTPFARKEYMECRDTWRLQDDPIEKARRWYALVSMSFSADIHTNKGWGFAATARARKNPPVEFSNTVARLYQCANRLKQVQIECADFRTIFRHYDSPDAVFYLDPPYLASTRKSGGYQHEMTDKAHVELLDLAQNCAARVVMSGYANPMYDEALADWQRIDISTFAHATGKTKSTKLQGAGSGRQTRRIECLWIKPNAVIQPRLLEV